MTTVAIIGSGLIGRSWAIAHARAGNSVHLWDRDPAAALAARQTIAESLPDLVAHDLLNGQDEQTVLDRILPVAELDEALSDAGFVHENTPERIEVKQEVYARLDPKTPPGVVIASSTSSLLPSAFTKELAGRARCLVVHPINPPHIIPAAEIVPAPWTSEAAMAEAVRVLEAIGNCPIVMAREIDGFIMNRLQGAVMDEAFRLVAEGYASVEDIDIGMRMGIGLRWSFIGPFETCDLNAPGGIRDYVERYRQIFIRMNPDMAQRVDWTGPVLDDVERACRDRLPIDQIAARQTWRDRRLLALMADKRKADREIGN